MDTTAGRADAVTQRRVQFRATATHITNSSAFSSLIKSAFTAFASNSGNGSRIPGPDGLVFNHVGLICLSDEDLVRTSSHFFISPTCFHLTHFQPSYEFFVFWLS